MTLGPKNNSPDATSLPVKLAIALLKDRSGRIKLDVPVVGRLDDPKFQIAPIIWHVVVNIMIKAATSPFSLLGSMFGGGEELSFVAFQPGLATIPDTETNKLETLTKALDERPELTMEINGSVDPSQDRAPLARMKLDQQLKSLWVKQLTDAGQPAVPIDEVQLQPADRERMIQKNYKLVIGEYKPTEAPTNVPPAAFGQSEPPVRVSRVCASFTWPRRAVAYASETQARNRWCCCRALRCGCSQPNNAHAHACRGF